MHRRRPVSLLFIAFVFALIGRLALADEREEKHNDDKITKSFPIAIGYVESKRCQDRMALT